MSSKLNEFPYIPNAEELAAFIFESELPTLQREFELKNWAAKSSTWAEIVDAYATYPQVFERTILHYRKRGEELHAKLISAFQSCAGDFCYNVYPGDCAGGTVCGRDKSDPKHNPHDGRYGHSFVERVNHIEDGNKTYRGIPYPSDIDVVSPRTAFGYGVKSARLEARLNTLETNADMEYRLQEFFDREYLWETAKIRREDPNARLDDTDLAINELLEQLAETFGIAGASADAE